MRRKTNCCLYFKTHFSICLCLLENEKGGSKAQPKYLTWPGIETTTFRSSRGYSNQLATQPWVVVFPIKQFK